MRLTDFLDADEAESAKPPPDDPQFVTVNGDGVLDRLNEAAEWEDILVYGAQWETAKPQDRETLKAFKRPGGTYDISAKVLKANPHVLVVHSDAAGLPYGKGQKLTKGRVYAHLHYNGDLKAAAQALARGTAVGLPAHVVDAVRFRDNIAGTVTEVTANQILGDSGEQRPGNPEEYLEVKVVEEALKLKIRELARERWAQEKAGETVLPDFIRLDDFLAQEVTEEPQLIKGLWNKATPVLFSAQFKAGKTTVRDNAVKCLVDGGRFLDRYDVTPVTDGTIVMLDLDCPRT